MTITIRLKTGNAAFTDPDADEKDREAQDAARDTEVSRILHHWLDRWDGSGGPTYLRDANGNTVGSVTVTGK